MNVSGDLLSSILHLRKSTCTQQLVVCRCLFLFQVEFFQVPAVRFRGSSLYKHKVSRIKTQKNTTFRTIESSSPLSEDWHLKNHRYSGADLRKHPFWCEFHPMILSCLMIFMYVFKVHIYIYINILLSLNQP